MVTSGASPSIDNDAPVLLLLAAVCQLARRDAQRGELAARAWLADVRSAASERVRRLLDAAPKRSR
jgi:hypothetical protein